MNVSGPALVEALRLEHRAGKVVEAREVVPRPRADKVVARGERRTDQPGMPSP